MFSISFDFDETTQKVSNLKVVSLVPKELPESENYIEVQDNKLKLGKAAVSMLNAKADDRISVCYWTVNNQETFPIIGKAEVFTDSTGGNRLTKSGTLSFRGNQRTVLLEYGNLFTLEPFKDDMFKLIPIKDEDSLETEKDELESLDKMTNEDFDFIEDLPF